MGCAAHMFGWASFALAPDLPDLQPSHMQPWQLVVVMQPRFVKAVAEAVKRPKARCAEEERSSSSKSPFDGQRGGATMACTVTHASNLLIGLVQLGLTC